VGWRFFCAKKDPLSRYGRNSELIKGILKELGAEALFLRRF
jgi:hypothetical protein